MQGRSSCKETVRLLCGTVKVISQPRAAEREWQEGPSDGARQMMDMELKDLVFYLLSFLVLL